MYFSLEVYFLYLNLFLLSALHDHPTHVSVYQRGPNSVLAKWRGVGTYPGEESVDGYIVRMLKIEHYDIKMSCDIPSQNII